MSKQKKKNIILLSILAGVAAITFWVLFEPGGDEAKITNIFTTTIPTNQIESQKLPSKKIFDQGLEQDQRFRELEDMRDYIPDTKSKSRDNPFIPIR
jgi:hypothetical protein